MHSPDVPVPKKTYIDTPVPVAQMSGTPVPRSADDAASALQSKVPGSNAKCVKGHAGDPYIVVKSESILDGLKFLRDDPAYLCQNLTVIAATDYLKKTQAKAKPPAKLELKLFIFFIPIAIALR